METRRYRKRQVEEEEMLTDRERGSRGYVRQPVQHQQLKIVMKYESLVGKTST